MFITSLKQGVDSDEWRNASATAQQLVWSVVAPMDKDNRQRLLKLVPELLQKLRTGLESISFSPFETTNLFKQLETVHLARLRGDQKPVAEAATSSAAALEAKATEMATKNADMKAAMLEAQRKAQQAASAAIQSSVTQSSIVQPLIAQQPENQTEQRAQAVTSDAAAEVSEPIFTVVAESAAVVNEAEAAVEMPAANEVSVANEELAASEDTSVATQSIGVSESTVDENISANTHDAAISESIQVDPQHLALVSNITQGTWFEMQGDAGEKYRCRLAAIIRSVGKYIFVNRSGMKVAEESRESLALALQTKRLTILDDGMLFDRALEAVIGTLRDQRNLS